jgi:serine-type D-Ala-D-Ala endopeptidase (penicillin-binding protein 7)
MIFRSNLLRKMTVALLSSSLLLGAQVSSAQNTTNKQTKQTTQQTAKKKAAPKNQKQVRTSTTRAKSAKAPDEKRPSFAAAMGLRGNQDDLNLKSSVALIVDRETHEVLFEKNAHAALPIASITKLMTSLVVLEAQLPLDETIVIEQADVNAYPGRTRSRVTQGAKMTREQAMILSLMSSENRVSQALGRNFPGGIPAFVDAMNAKAKLLGMSQSKFADPTGLSSENVSSPEDLTRG